MLYLEKFIFPSKDEEFDFFLKSKENAIHRFIPFKFLHIMKSLNWILNPSPSYMGGMVQERQLPLMSSQNVSSLKEPLYLTGLTFLKTIWTCASIGSKKIFRLAVRL